MYGDGQFYVCSEILTETYNFLQHRYRICQCHASPDVLGYGQYFSKYSLCALFANISVTAFQFANRKTLPRKKKSTVVFPSSISCTSSPALVSLCSVCGNEAGAHHCTLCGKVVHILCSGANSQSDEGHGQSRICFVCSGMV